MTYGFVEAGAVVEGPMALPVNWRNVSGLDRLDAAELRALGWLPWRLVEIQAEVLTGSTVQVFPSEIVETQTGRDRTPEEIAAALDDWRRAMTVSPLQMRRALRQAGLYDAVTAYVAGQDADTQDAWEYAVQIDRMDPLIAGAASSFGMSDTAVDDLFRLAATLECRRRV